MSAIDPTQLRIIAEKGAQELADATPAELITWTAEQCGTNFVIASNMQDAALIDIAVKSLVTDKLSPADISILFLDTGYHFPETLGIRDAIKQIYGVNIINIEPELTIIAQAQKFGPDLFARDPGKCCTLRKVTPLAISLAKYDAWITGVRRVEAPTRAHTPVITFDEKFGLMKINPIAPWDDNTLYEYIDQNRVLVNPLVNEGYPSIGCAPCTHKPLPGADPRSGRWQGSTKTECGLHVQ